MPRIRIRYWRAGPLAVTAVPRVAGSTGPLEYRGPVVALTLGRWYVYLAWGRDTAS